MAYKLADHFAEFDLHSQPMERGLQRVSGQLGGFSQRMEAVSRRARWMLAGGIAGLAYFVKQAADVEEQTSKFEAVFKEQGIAARAFADQLAKSINRSTYEVQQFLASMQDTFVPLGFARNAARDLSQTVVKLAYDLASFNNTADPEALMSLQSAIVGNHEAVRKYGIIITEGTLKQELLRMGIKKSVQEVTNLEKVTARLNIIMRSSSDAQGDAERTAGSFTNQMKGLRATFREFMVEIGQIYVPQLLGLIQKLRDATTATRGFSREHPGVVSGLTKITLGLGATVAFLPAIVTRVTLLTAGFRSFAAFASVGLVGALGMATAAISALAAALMIVDDATIKWRRRMAELGRGIANTGDALADATSNLEAYRIELERLQEPLTWYQRNVLGLDPKQHEAQISAMEATIRRLEERIKRIRKERTTGQAANAELKAEQELQEKRFELRKRIEDKITQLTQSETMQRIIRIKNEYGELQAAAGKVGLEGKGLFAQLYSASVAKIKDTLEEAIKSLTERTAFEPPTAQREPRFLDMMNVWQDVQTAALRTKTVDEQQLEEMRKQRQLSEEERRELGTLRRLFEQATEHLAAIRGKGPSSAVAGP